MSIEEKAKAYDKALNWMRKLYPGLHGATKEDAEHYFPELRESEDEIHRKWILEYLYDGLRKSDEQFKDHFKSAIDWLEKQKEPHYTKRNALFDKCVKNCDPEVMKEVSDKVDEMLGKEQKPSCWNSPVMTHEMIMGKQKPETFNEPYNSDEYEAVEMGNATCLRRKEQKPAEWSEEEIGHIYTLASYIKSKGYEDDGEFLEGVANKLKSLRPQPHWKPSEEQMEALRNDAYENGNSSLSPYSISNKALASLYEQLKNL